MIGEILRLISTSLYYRVIGTVVDGEVQPFVGCSWSGLVIGVTMALEAELVLFLLGNQRGVNSIEIDPRDAGIAIVGSSGVRVMTVRALY